MRVCNLSSGSDGNITYIETQSAKILVDIGLSCSEVQNRLKFIGVEPSEITAILITHEHSDHIKGLDVFVNKFRPKVYVHYSSIKGGLTIPQVEDRIVGETLKYHIFDPRFKGVPSYDKNGLLELSYSKMKYYIECPFKYFLCKILKIDEFDGNFDTELGTLFHKILEDSLDKEIFLDNYTQDLNEKFTTNKEQYFALKCLPQILDVIKFNKEFDSTTSFKTILGEQEFKVNLDQNTIFTAQIDKLLYDEESKCVVVIDYKTGDFSFDPKCATIGLHLQLPTYSLIVKKVHPEFKTIGMYIENILLKKEDLKALNPYKLAGLTNSDIPMIQLIDPTFLQVDEDGKLITKSKFIRAIQISQDNIKKGLYNFTHPTNLKTEQEIQDLEQLTEQHIIECVKKIRSGAFEISPIKDNGLRIDACQNCKFADVCCKTDANYRIMNLKESEAK